jgi:hypothetical protein
MKFEMQINIFIHVNVVYFNLDFYIVEMFPF